MKYLNLKWFDYIYYRIYLAYSKTKDPDPWLYAINIVTVVQVFNFLLPPLCVIRISYSNYFNPNYDKLVKLCLVLLSGVLWIHNYYRYKKKTYEYLFKIWVNENKITKRRNGYFVLLYILISFFAPIIYIFIKKNLGM
ncbi:hypothetical protein BSYN_23240 [Bacteroides sedimenti]|uniref:Uncharacterized protein n=1 Tax=Bacteroides sedimenti TaxID=2136147 RepID=A0ABN6ZD98_9BACE